MDSRLLKARSWVRINSCKAAGFRTISMVCLNSSGLFNMWLSSGFRSINCCICGLLVNIIRIYSGLDIILWTIGLSIIWRIISGLDIRSCCILCCISAKDPPPNPPPPRPPKRPLPNPDPRRPLPNPDPRPLPNPDPRRPEKGSPALWPVDSPGTGLLEPDPAVDVDDPSLGFLLLITRWTVKPFLISSGYKFGF